MELKKYRLGDIAEIIGGVSYSPKDICTGGIRILRGGNIQNQHIELKTDDVFLPISYKNNISQIYVGDTILVASTGSVDVLGKAATCFQYTEDVQIGAFLRIIRPKADKYTMLISSALSSDYFKRYIKAQAKGTSINNITLGYLRDFEIYAPHDFTGLSHLSANIENKICLNRAINDNLEAMAKQLYDYWFVQFDFPNEEGKPYKSSGGAMVWNEKLKRKIPNGWTVETVGTYANCKSGYAIKSSDFKAKGIPVIKIGNIQEDYTLNMNGCQYIDNNANKLFYVYQNDVVIAMTGATIGKFAIVPYSETGYFVNQRVGKFELGNNPIKKMPYLINSLKIDYFRNQIFQLASGCAQPNISAEQINNISLLYPSTKILSVYNMKCKWMYEQIANCRYQIDVLTKLRDKLLPLLMNGQASVNSD